MIKISRAKLSDTKALLRLETKVWKEPVTSRYDMPMFIRFGHVFVAKDSGKIIGGIVAYNTRNNEVFVCDWFKDSKYKHERIGSKVYQELINSVDKPIIAFINSKNTPSINAHKKLGFKRVRKIKNAYSYIKGLDGGESMLVRLENKK